MRIVNDGREDAIQEAKIFAIIAPTILPLIERRKKDANGRLIQNYKSGRTDSLTIIAELSVLSDLENEINQKRLLYDTLTEEPNGRR
jgi:hypothetical protein